MKMRKFDPSLWNLALPLGVLGGCGPLVPVNGDTDTDSTDPTNPSDPSDPSDPSSPSDPTVDPTGDQCPEVPCPQGYYCNNYQQCVPDYYCEDYCCYDDDDGCCYGEGCCNDGGCWYDCYGLTECGYASFCEGYGYCSVIPQAPNCGEMPATSVVELALAGTAALVFVDGDGDAAHELVATDANQLIIVSSDGSGDIVATASDASVTALAAGDLDGDGDEDVVALNGDGVVSFMVNDGAGSFALAGSLETGYIGELDLGDFDGNDTTDLLIGQGPGIPPRIWLGLTGLEFVPTNELEVYDTVLAQDVGQIDSTSASDIVVHDYGTLNFWIGDGSPGGPPDLSFYEQFGLYGVEGTFLTVGDFDGDGIDDVARTLYWSGYALVDSWQGNSFYELEEWGYPMVPLGTASGDLNGDGSDDLLVATQGSLTVRYGTTAFDGVSLFGCVQNFVEPGGAFILATGDFDGDGRDDLAYSWGSTPYVLSIH